MNTLTPDRLNLPSTDRRQMLQFQLQTDLRVAIEIDLVMELMNIPLDRVVPMPHLPPAVMGVYNWRGEILWIVDLSRILGLTANPTPRLGRTLQPTIVLTNRGTGTNHEAATIGCIVTEVNEIEWCQPHLLPSTPDLVPAPWRQGYWKSATGEIWAGLDGQAIFDRAELHANL
jgi:positive phototaxis protein PixI